MRLRNIKGSEEIIALNKWCINEPENYKGIWKTVFCNNNPIQIEVGMGKGNFILSLAKENPNTNYIGIEKYSSVLLRALQKLETDFSMNENELNNIKFICMDAENINNTFDINEIERIYLNFSDPWPKDRHAKRRLTSRQFLSRYDKLLTSNGRIEFKTDNKDLFEFSLTEIENSNWKLKAVTNDLHHNTEMMAGNIMTEYEERYSSMGNPIYKLIAFR